MILVITSPDSLSIGMFSDYVSKRFMSVPALINISGLLSEDFQSAVVEQSLSSLSGRDIIFRHKTRKMVALNKLPATLTEKADCIVSLGLYSNHPEVVKNFPGWTENVISSYAEHIARENGQAS
jgi:hypothetical protein